MNQYSLWTWSSKYRWFKCVINIYNLDFIRDPDSKIHGANMGPTWVLAASGGSHVGHMTLAIWGD